MLYVICFYSNRPFSAKWSNANDERIQNIMFALTDIVMLSVMRRLFGIDGRSLQCQYFATIRASI